MNPPAGELDRIPTLRRTGAAIFAMVLVIVGVGVVSRQPVEADDASAVFLPQQRDRPGAISIDVGAGLTVEELGETMTAAGISRADSLEAILAAPGSLDLPEVLHDVQNLRGHLGPGRFSVSPTTDAATLVAEMARSFARNLDQPTMEKIAERGRTLSEVVTIAAHTEQVATTRSEMPFVAGMLWNIANQTPSDTAVVSSEALLAAAFPARTTQTSWFRDGEGDLRLGQPPTTPTTPTTVSSPVEDISALASRSLQIARGRVSAVAIDADGQMPIAIHPHRLVELASVYKVAVLAVTMDEVQHGRLELDGQLRIQLPDTGPTSLPADMTLREALKSMIIDSDNTTAVTIITGLGADVVNDRLRSWGIEEFSVGSKPQVASAFGVAQLLRTIEDGEHFGLGARAFMMNVLTSTNQTVRLAAYVGTPVAHKTGDLATVVNDAGILNVGNDRITAVVLIEDVEVRQSADQAIGRFGGLVSDYYIGYLPARAAVRAGEHAGCTTPPLAQDGPLSGVRVAIDPGHGGQDPGATVTVSSGIELEESSVTLAAAMMMADRLAERGAEVFLTRCTDTFLGPTLRAALLNHANPDAIVSLHVDGSTAPEDNTTSVLYLDACDATFASTMLGTDEHPAMWAALSRDIPVANAGVLRRTIGVLPFVFAPAVLTEPVTISHPAEAEALSSGSIFGSERLRTIVDSHVDALVRHLSTEPVPAAAEAEASTACVRP